MQCPFSTFFSRLRRSANRTECYPVDAVAVKDGDAYPSTGGFFNVHFRRARFCSAYDEFAYEINRTLDLTEIASQMHASSPGGCSVSALIEAVPNLVPLDSWARGSNGTLYGAIIIIGNDGSLAFRRFYDPGMGVLGSPPFQLQQVHLTRDAPFPENILRDLRKMRKIPAGMMMMM